MVCVGYTDIGTTLHTPKQMNKQIAILFSAAHTIGLSHCMRLLEAFLQVSSPNQVFRKPESFAHCTGCMRRDVYAVPPTPTKLSPRVTHFHGSRDSGTDMLENQIQSITWIHKRDAERLYKQAKTFATHAWEHVCTIDVGKKLLSLGGW